MPTSDASIQTLRCPCGTDQLPWHQVRWMSFVQGDTIDLHPIVMPLGVCQACGRTFTLPQVHIDCAQRIAGSRRMAVRSEAREVRR